MKCVSRLLCQFLFFIERVRVCPELPPSAPPPLKPPQKNLASKNVAGSYKKNEAATKQHAVSSNKQPPATLPKPTNRAARSTGKCGHA